MGNRSSSFGKTGFWIRLNVFCILILVSWRLSSVFAGTITIETQTEATLTDTNLTTRVVLINQGDETARSITCEVTFQGKTEKPSLIEALPPKTPLTLTTTHTQIERKPGRYPLIVRVQFHDTNHYPFTALSALIVNAHVDASNDLAIEGNDISIDRKGEWSLILKNLVEEDRTLSYWVLVPRELSVREGKGSVSLPKRSQQSIAFQLENFAALYGAAYPVYVFFEYDTPEAHHCQMASTKVRIVLEPSWFQKTRIYWLIAGMLVLAGALYRFFGRGKTGKP